MRVVLEDSPPGQRPSSLRRSPPLWSSDHSAGGRTAYFVFAESTQMFTQGRVQYRKQSKSASRASPSAARRNGPPQGRVELRFRAFFELRCKTSFRTNQRTRGTTQGRRKRPQSLRTAWTG